MLFFLRIEGDILKANIAYISCVANYLPAIFARCIIYTHHMIDAVTAMDNHSIYLNWFHWLLLLLWGGGDSRTRTGDPLLAKQMLSQLSYIPILYGIKPKSTPPFDVPHTNTSMLRIASISLALRYSRNEHRSHWRREPVLNRHYSLQCYVLPVKLPRQKAPPKNRRRQNSFNLLHLISATLGLGLVSCFFHSRAS